MRHSPDTNSRAPEQETVGALEVLGWHPLVVAYDEELAARVREVLADEPALSEKRMFGGLAFLLGGNMAVSASGQGGLLVRCDPERTGTLVGEPGVKRFEMGGRSMDGWLHVQPEAVTTDQELARWVAVGVAYARALPVKR